MSAVAQGPQGMATKKPAGMRSNPAERGFGETRPDCFDRWYSPHSKG
jgi:hypothetical protein